MADVSYVGQTVSVNDEGFFTDPAQWTEDMAPQIARAEGIDHLTERHWQVIRFMRQEYQAKGTGPSVRALAKTSASARTTSSTRSRASSPSASSTPSRPAARSSSPEHAASGAGLLS